MLERFIKKEKKIKFQNETYPSQAEGPKKRN